MPKAVLGRKDIIGAAETGSGKTLAFGLPVLSEILTRRDAAAAAASEAGSEAVAAFCGGDGDGDAAGAEEEEGGGDGGAGGAGGEGLQALVVCPTRELALQVAAHLREVVRDTGLAVVVRFFGRVLCCWRMVGLVRAVTAAAACRVGSQPGLYMACGSALQYLPLLHARLALRRRVVLGACGEAPALLLLLLLGPPQTNVRWLV